MIFGAGRFMRISLVVMDPSSEHVAIRSGFLGALRYQAATSSLLH
jgi:hypothetical protein